MSKTPIQKEQESKNVKFDFTQFELNYILENANFTEEQEKIFNMLTSKYRRQTIVCISESTVKRRIKQIKKKILRLL